MNKITIWIGAIVLAGGFALGTFINEGKDYTPRKSRLQIEGGGEEWEERSATAYAEMMHKLRANQITNKVDPKDVYNAIRQADALISQRATKWPLEWQEKGPDNVGGRTRCILVDNQDPTQKTLYAGAVSGGLWKTTTAGSSWQRVNTKNNHNCIVSITQTPNGDIYYGTGENGFMGYPGGIGESGFNGGGIFMMKNGGSSFDLLSSTNPNTYSTFSSIQSMGSDPTNDRVYVAAAGGYYYSEDYGKNWKKATGSPNAMCLDLKVASNGKVFVCTSTGIFRSDDGKSPFSKVSKSPMGSTTNRISIALAPSNPNYIYAMASAASSNRLEGIYQSKDAGDTWTKIASGASSPADFDPLSNGLQGQGTWNNVIAVDPTDPERIFAAGVDWWEWQGPGRGTNSGWNKTALTGASEFSPYYIHADKHAIVFTNIDAQNKKFNTYIGSDGGIGKSTDGCNSFFTANKGYNVTQFYDVAADWRGHIVGGSQDNGTQYINGSRNTAKGAVEIMGGDGFQSEISHINPDIMFYSTYYGNVRRSLTGGTSEDLFFDCDMINKVDPKFGSAAGLSKCADKTSNFSKIFNTPILFREHYQDSSSIFAVGMNSTNGNGGAIFITREALVKNKLSNDGKPQWFRLAEGLNNDPKSIGISSNWNNLYCGTYRGDLYRFAGLNSATYTDSPRTVTGVTVKEISNNLPNGRIITSVEVDPNDSNHMIVTMGNYGNSSYIYETHNALDTVAANVTFTSIQSNLPLMPVYDISINVDDSKKLVAATDLGIWTSNDGGQTWVEANTGMERIPVFSIKQYEDRPWMGPTFYIGTHGRGFFMSNSQVTSIAEPQTTENTANLSVYPNPASDNINLSFSLQKTSNVFISVVDLSGKQVFNTELYSIANGNQNIPINISDLKAGTYLVFLKQSGRQEVKKFIKL
ncbi:MAG: T9SS type A sorting domain-containing protein [Bacteroidota bacterium]|nr:T9SS type A sorting domain-containing protein [Bacteroidota bacterium]